MEIEFHAPSPPLAAHKLLLYIIDLLYFQFQTNVYVKYVARGE